MKKQIQITLGALALLLLPFSGSAQGDISSIFKAGIGDIGALAQGYLKPAGSGFAAGLGSNWYNTAATHSVLGLELTLGSNFSIVPTSDQTFSLSGLRSLTPNTGVTQAPTFGGSGDGVLLKLLQPNTINGVPNPKAGQLITSFTTPGGVAKYVFTGAIQLGIGLPMGTDITFRYSPKLKTTGMSAGLWGVGLKHNIKQWIPVVNVLPFDASVMVAYTKFKLDYAFADQLLYTQLGDASMFKAPAIDLSTGQGFAMDVDALMANFIISKSLLFFTPYIGVGVTRTNFSLKFNGVYPLLGNPITDPKSLDFGKLTVDYYPNATTALPEVTTAENMLGTTVGFRIKLFLITALHAQYTFQKYPTASFGFGINFR